MKSSVKISSGHALKIMKALSDRTRLRILALISSGEICACQIIDVLKLAPSTVSKHTGILHDAGLIEKRKAGKWYYFRLAPFPAHSFLRVITGHLLSIISDDPVIKSDFTCLREQLRRAAGNPP